MGLEMPPDQKAFQMESTWERSSPVSMSGVVLKSVDRSVPSAGGRPRA